MVTVEARRRLDRVCARGEKLFEEAAILEMRSAITKGESWTPMSMSTLARIRRIFGWD